MLVLYMFCIVLYMLFLYVSVLMRKLVANSYFCLFVAKSG